VWVGTLETDELGGLSFETVVLISKILISMEEV
jgi:hypothetical protein